MQFNYDIFKIKLMGRLAKSTGYDKFIIKKAQCTSEQLESMYKNKYKTDNSYKIAMINALCVMINAKTNDINPMALLTSIIGYVNGAKTRDDATLMNKTASGVAYQTILNHLSKLFIINSAALRTMLFENMRKAQADSLLRMEGKNQLYFLMLL